MSTLVKDAAAQNRAATPDARSTESAPMPTMLGAASAQLGAGVLQRKLRDRALQRKPADATNASADGGQATLAAGAAAAPTSGGAALPAPLQKKMSESMGEDFSSVRVHQGEHVREVGAAAYAAGNDIHFAPGEYQPDSHSGQELIGHELAHVQQQRQGRVAATTQARGVPVNNDGGLEREADDRGAKAARGESAGPSAGGGSSSGGAAASASAAPVQYKLKMVAGYTEAMNWSGEAVTLIAAYDKFVETHEKLLPNPAVGKSYKKFRKLRTPITTFRTTVENRTIPNKRDVRVAQTQEIEGWTTKAEIAHAEMERVAQRSVKPTAPVSVDSAPGMGDKMIKPHAEHDYESTPETETTRSGLVPSLKPPSDPSTPEPAPVVDPSAPPQPGLARQMVDAIEIKLVDTPAWLAKKLGVEKLETERKGRMGEMTGGVKGGLSSSSSDGGTIKHELQGKVSLIVGKTQKFTSEPMDVLSLARGHKAQMVGAIEGMVGSKNEVSVNNSVSYSGTKGGGGSLKGSVSAFTGGSIEISPQIRIVNSSGETLTSITGTGGLAYGLGGAYEGMIAWEDGKFKFTSKGKLSAGLGVTWGMSAEINVGSVIYNLLFGT